MKLTCTLVLSALSSGVGVSAQESQALFDAPVVAFPEDTSMTSVLDIDGDGDMDAIGWWNFGATVRLKGYTNDGNGGFSQRYLLFDTAPFSRYTTAAMEVGQFDGSGSLDFVTRFDTDVKVYRLGPSGYPTLHASWQEAAFGSTDTLTVGDFDADGLADIALTAGGVLRVYRSTGTGFALASVYGSSSASQVHAIDVDGDGDSDIASVRPGRLDFLISNAGVLTPGPSHPNAASRFNEQSFFTSGDIDGDGDEDIVVFAERGEYVVFRRTGTADFVAEPKQTGGPATGLADIDGDGNLDGVCCGGGGSSPNYNTIDSRYHISINRGGGSFADAYVIPSLGARRLAGAADVDGDGDLDLVAGRSVLYNRGNLAEPLQPSLTLDSNESTYIANDRDGDGDPDLEPTIRSYAFDYGYFRNDGAGGFADTDPVKPPWPTGGFDVGPGFPGDFDGDGDLDLIVGMISPQHTGMELWENRGGAYVDAGPATHRDQFFHPDGRVSRYGPRAIVADLDNDGDADIVPSNVPTDVWLNDGTGFFLRGQRLAEGATIAAADLDGDGNRDLVFNDQQTIRLLFGIGDGSFAGLMTFPAEMNAYTDRMAVADIDGDGDIDICGVDRKRSRLQILTNLGGRSFNQWEPQDASIHATGNEPRRVYASDIDGDGLTDLVFGPARNAFTSSWILRGAGTSTGFAEPILQVVSIAALVDVDGDGDPDAVARDRLVRNPRFGSEAGARLQFGDSAPGLGGIAPTLGSTGVRAGAPIETVLTGAPGGTVVAYGFSLSRANLVNFPLTGLTVYAWPWVASATFATSGSPGSAGEGVMRFPYTMPAASAGLVLYKQAFVLDPSRPHSLGYTNGLEIRYGR